MLLGAVARRPCRTGTLVQLWLDPSVPDPVAAFAAAHGISEPVQAPVVVVGLEASPADEWLIRYAARRVGARQLVIGSHRRSRWPRLLNGSTVANQVLRAAGNLSVQVVNVGRPDKTSHEWPSPREAARQHRGT